MMMEYFIFVIMESTVGDRSIHTVINTSWAADVLYYRAKLISDRLPLPPLPIEVARNVVYRVTHSLVERRLIWLNTADRRFISWNSILDLWDESWVTCQTLCNIPELFEVSIDPDDPDLAAGKSVHDILIGDILDPMLGEIDDKLLSPLIAFRTWDILNVVPLVGGDCILTNDGDYRIWDWEQQRLREGGTSEKTSGTNFGGRKMMHTPMR